ncbi:MULTISPECIES: hypothetical protein [Nostoc]|uniref:Uncharacterized protein n=1 Tax=Nostoc paludosum FACHB-159 TaxID=2692908 RepID=A0ABR8K3I2_9NOSO|nr:MULTISPECIES: hypothetical protein [Nostoc]MBD2677839.1 hypothetical protein [Nostoc sp. FACHB-857]MBD2733986.1 hypothetical protein [Nostoc paludosum FACHB-159]
MNSKQNNKSIFLSFGIIVFIWLLSGIIYTIFVVPSSDNIINWLMHKKSSTTQPSASLLSTPNTQTQALNDEQFDKMIERSNRIHHIVEQHVFSLFIIFGGTIFTILTTMFALGGKKWIKDNMDKEMQKQYQDKVMSFINETSKLMTLFSWINDEQILSNFTLSIPANNIKILQDDLEKILNSIKQNFPENKYVQPFFHVKEGDLCYCAAKLLNREADYKKSKDKKEQARDYYNQARKAYERAISEKFEDIKIFESIFWSQIVN